jgi:hypothetical protein
VNQKRLHSLRGFISKNKGKHECSITHISGAAKLKTSGSVLCLYFNRQVRYSVSLSCGHNSEKQSDTLSTCSMYELQEVINRYMITSQ